MAIPLPTIRASISLSAADPISSTEGSSTGLVTLATLQDSNPNAPASDFANTVSIAWGDGSSSPATLVSQGSGAFQVQGSHTYLEERRYAITISASDVGGSTAQPATTHAYVADAPISISSDNNLVFTEGQPFSNQVIATLYDTDVLNTDSTDFTGSVAFGDGGSAPLSFKSLGTGQFAVMASYTYLEEGNYGMNIQVRDIAQSASASPAVYVADAPISLSPAVQVRGTEGLSTGLVTVATLTDTNPNAPISDFTNNVTINWGDGNSSPATLAAQGSGVFLVQGSYTYAEEGIYNVTVSASDKGGSVAPAVPPTIADIVDAPISLTPQPVGVIEQTPTGTMTIATLNDTNTANTDATDFQGTFQCSDGTSGQLSFVNESSGVFAVQIPSDTFSDEGTFTVSYSAVDHYQSASNTTQISVAEGAMGVSLGASVLQASSDGMDPQNIVPLSITTHYEADASWSLSLSASGANEVDVWQTPTPGPGDTPLLGLVNGSVVSSTYWPTGEQPPSTLYVGAYAASTTMTDIQFALAEGEPNAPSTTATSQPVPAVFPHIMSAADPNGDKMTDLTNKTRNILVGQIVHDTVKLEGPQALTQNATYQWDNPPGVTEYSYTQTATNARTVDLIGDNGALPNGGPHTGTQQQDIQFFWVSTTAAAPNPDTDKLSVAVTLNNGNKLNKVSTTCQVFAPQANIQITQGNVGIWVYQGQQVMGLGPAGGNGYGIGWTTTVATPAGNGFGQGEFNYLQLFKNNRTRTVNAVNQHLNVNGQWMLDNNWNPYKPALDPNTNQPVTPFNAPNGGQAWMTDAGPGFSIDAPAVSYGLAGMTYLKMLDEANTYVMYLPPGTGSQWVPLVMEDWSYAAVADTTTGPFVFNATSSWKSLPNFAPATNEPTWTQPPAAPAWVND